MEPRIQSYSRGYRSGRKKHSYRRKKIKKEKNDNDNDNENEREGEQINGDVYDLYALYDLYLTRCPVLIQ